MAAGRGLLRRILRHKDEYKNNRQERGNEGYVAVVFSCYSQGKGQFVVMKTGTHPMRVTLKLFFKWGIQFDEKNPYTVKDNGNRVAAYADKQELIDAITERYTPKLATRPGGSSDDPTGRQSQDYADRPVPKVDKILREVKSALPYEDDAVINAFVQEEAMEEVKSRG